MNSDGTQNTDMSAYADEHSLDAQRYYNLLCIVYGSDAARFAGIVKADLLPKERADRCPDESHKIIRSWARLLLPHFAPHYRPSDNASAAINGGSPPATAQPSPKDNNPLEWDGKSNAFGK
jgi:hypothetical protein